MLGCFEMNTGYGDQLSFLASFRLLTHIYFHLGFNDYNNNISQYPAISTTTRISKLNEWGWKSNFGSIKNIKCSVCRNSIPNQSRILIRTKKNKHTFLFFQDCLGFASYSSSNYLHMYVSCNDSDVMWIEPRLRHEKELEGTKKIMEIECQFRNIMKFCDVMVATLKGTWIKRGREKKSYSFRSLLFLEV